jgi:tRNA 2-thiouridine synthesizing protein A
VQLRSPLQVAQVANADDLVGRVLGQGARGVAELAGEILVNEQVAQMGLLGMPRFCPCVSPSGFDLSSLPVMPKLNPSEKEFVSAFGELPAIPAADATPVRPASGTMQELDARGISPPLPVLRTHRALRAMQVGQVLKVLTTQPQSVPEFQSLVKHVPQYELVSQEEKDGDYIHLLRKRR